MRLFVTLRLFVISWTALSLMPAAASGQIRQFPYEAVIETDGLSIRSGPGMRKYYATGTLKRGARVMITRHDPGGWYMIAPPQGSFSWIRAEYVDADSDGNGLLNSNNIVVRVGSTLSDSRDIVQRRLSTGDRVKILGEKTVSTEAGQIRMYKITPPRGEYRWIQGRYVTPISQLNRSRRNRDPFARPTQARVPDAASKTITTPGKYDSRPQRFSRSLAGEKKTSGGTGRSGVRTKPSGSAVRRSGPTDEQIATDRQRLRQIDDRFRAIIHQKASHWDFTRLEHDYHALQKSTTIPALASQIDLRFDTLKRYKGIKAEYDSFIRLTSETSRREAELLSLQRRQRAAPNTAGTPTQRTPLLRLGTPVPIPTTPTPSVSPQYRPSNRPSAGQGPVLRSRPQSIPLPRSVVPRSTSSVPVQSPVTTRYRQQVVLQRRQPVRQPVAITAIQPQPIPVPPAGGQQVQSAPSRTVVHGTPPAVDRAPTAAAGQPVRYDAAGIIRRAQATFPGAPKFALVSPSGQLLAYVQGGRGIKLESYLGRPVGVAGRRYHRAGVPLELIVVRTLAPVQLAPSR